MRTSYERNDWARGLFAGVCLGGTVGAVLALLYAPASGKELRSNVKATSNKLLSDAEEILEKAKTRTSEMAQNGIRQLTDEGTRVKEAVKAGVDTYKRTHA